MTDARDVNYDYWAFPSERYTELENELRIFPEVMYEVTDLGNDLIYLEIKRSSHTPGSLADILISLHGERLNSRKDFVERMQDHEFI